MTLDIGLREFQQLIRGMYHEKDVARGVDGTFMWLMEEVGELAASLREGTLAEQSAEFADVLAWLTTIANVAGVDLLRSRRGPLVLEVNSSPGLEGIEAATGVDVAGEVIEYLARRQRQRKLAAR